MDNVGELSVAGFGEQLRELSETVTQERASFDSAGRLPDDLFRRLAAIGLFRLWLPVGLGGPELSALDFMDVVEEAAALEGTIGWLAGNGGGMARVGAFLPVHAARDLVFTPLRSRSVRARLGASDLPGRAPCGRLLARQLAGLRLVRYRKRRFRTAGRLRAGPFRPGIPAGADAAGHAVPVAHQRNLHVDRGDRSPGNRARCGRGVRATGKAQESARRRRPTRGARAGPV